MSSVSGEVKRMLPFATDGTATPETPPDHKLSRKASIGYNPLKFAGKLSQKDVVMDVLRKQNWIPAQKVRDEVELYYGIGIDDLYFSETSVDTIAGHVLSLYGAKCKAAGRPSDEGLQVQMTVEEDDHAVYIDTSFPGVTNVDGPLYEERLESRYLNFKPGNDERVFRLETFRSNMEGVGKKGQELRSYFVNQCHFVKADPTPEEDTDLDLISDKTFLEKVTANTKMIYQKMITAVRSRTGPVIDRYEVEGTGEWRIVIGLKRGSGENYLSAITDLYHFYGMTSPRKYVEQFSNGIAVMSVYLVAGPSLKMDMKDAIYQMVREASLIFCIPKNLFQDQFVNGVLSLQQSVYAHCVSIFITHFLNRLGIEYTTLRQQLDPNNNLHQQLLSKLKRRLRGETYTRNDIVKAIRQNPDVIKVLYHQFSSTHRIAPSGHAAEISRPTSVAPGQDADKVSRAPVPKRSMGSDELVAYISANTTNEHQLRILTGFAMFNAHVLKTNFYQPTKSALSFRFDPAFLPEEEYPQKLFAMFLVVGSEFRGFHLRFENVARGGIRIVTSRSKEAYSINVRSLFDENYALALTQNRKNKDLPEGGAKGVILLDASAQDKGEVSFHKYVDSLIDLLLEGTSPSIKDKIVDLYGQEETLYCGPDEGTAGLVDWATMHAKARGAPWWKSFFTGKSKSLGGIPHDVYGMTSLSVRQYLTMTYKKLGIEETAMTKVQTGGPDGDLGSNEILLSKEKYVVIIDGSGVLCDPAGLGREQLLALAKSRKTISSFDVGTLSPNGYRVLVDETNVTLPSGEVIKRGIDFRNTAHLRNFGAGREGKSADVLSPQGGRPEAINISNVGQLVENGIARYSYIIEGANLFITQDARLELEKAGCIVFKDASTNKGGVTSSSLEVLASLSFDSEEFIEHMCVRDGKEPAFYTAYVEQIQEVIKHNAEMEFEAIWKEHERTNVPRAILSDRLSKAIVDLQKELQHSSLYDKVELRNRVLHQALPNLLIESIGFETLIGRIEPAYLRALFGSYLASRFIYKYGIAASQFAMYEFISSLEQ